MIRDRKKKYMDFKKMQLTESDANRSFFRLVKALKTPKKPQTFDVRNLRPGEDGKAVAENLAAFFNRISSEFDPLSEEQIPKSRPRRLELLKPLSARIRRF